MEEMTKAELLKKLQDTEEQLQKAKELNKELSEKYNSLKEDYNNEVEEANGSTASILEEAQLKNEAYGFIISQGLLDKFIAKRISREREPLEAALDYLLLSAEAFGDWIKDL